MTKRQAKRLLGLKRDADLAAHFGIRRQAVSQWVHLPELRELQLRQHLQSRVKAGTPVRKKAA